MRVIYVEARNENLRIYHVKYENPTDAYNSRAVKCNACARGARGFVSARNFSDSGSAVPRFNALMGFIPERAINSSLRLPAPLRVSRACLFREGIPLTPVGDLCRSS